MEILYHLHLQMSQVFVVILFAQPELLMSSSAVYQEYFFFPLSQNNPLSGKQCLEFAVEMYSILLKWDAGRDEGLPSCPVVKSST